MSCDRSDFSDDDIDNMDFALPTTSSMQPQSQQQKQVSNTSPFTSLISQIPKEYKQPLQSDQPSIDQSLIKDWICIYPLYLDVSKSFKKERRVPKSIAVKEPAAIYIAESIKVLKLNGALEVQKRHPKDPLVFGRVKVELKVNGVFVHPFIRTKKQLMVEICRVLPGVVESFKLDVSILQIAAESRSELRSVIEGLSKVEPKESIIKSTVKQTSIKRKNDNK